MKLSRLALVVTAIALTFAFSGVAQAALIVAEPFTYDNGQLAGLNGGVAGSGSWTSAWYGSTGPNVQSGELKAQNNSTHRNFTGVADGSTVYIGATLVMPSGDNSIFSIELNDPTNTGVGAYSTQGFGERDGQYSLNGSKSGGLPFATYIRFVCRVELNYSGTQDRMTLWADPINDGSFDVLESGSFKRQETRDIFDGALTTIGFQGQALGPTLTVDNINIVTTFEEAANAVVPEPGTLALLGIGAGLLAARKRRK